VEGSEHGSWLNRSTGPAADFADFEPRQIDRIERALVDGRTVETGSFNYTLGAARSNSENELVVWNDPQVAARHLEHWQSRWAQGSELRE
jgi:hypothetical protein